MLAITHILAAVDGSPQSREAYRSALALARDWRARLTALYVAVPLYVPSPFELNARAAQQAEDAARARGQQVLAEALSIADGAVPVDTELVFGDPAPEICKRARERRADLIVMGTRGVGGIGRLFARSVSTGVVQDAPCSVLVIRGRSPIIVQDGPALSE